jgi:hypothetical protein
LRRWQGFISIHSAAISFTGWLEYEMLKLARRPSQDQFSAPLVVEDTFPGMKNFRRRFTVRRGVSDQGLLSKDVRVLLSLDAGKRIAQGVKRTG